MIINREDFITEMAKRNGVTKKASREYTEMFLNTFFELLTEGHTIRFWRLFSARIITSAETNTSVNPNTNPNERMKKPPYRSVYQGCSVWKAVKISTSPHSPKT